MDDAKTNYAPSSAANKAAVNQNIFNDLIREMTTTVNKK